MLRIEPLSAEDKAVIPTQTAEEHSTKPRVRRSRSTLRKEATERVLDGFRILHARLKKLKENPRSSEDDVRVWCRGVLTVALGYSESDIALEQTVLGNFADMLVSDTGTVLFVIECKKLGVKLGKQARDQAVGYALNLCTPWAVLTNGDIWRLFRVIQSPGKHPEIYEVFDVALLDEDGVSEADADKLYLLTKRCMTTREIEDEWEKEHASSTQRLMKALFSKRVVSALRIELNESYKVDFDKIADLDDDLTREEMEDCFLAKDLGS